MPTQLNSSCIKKHMKTLQCQGLAQTERIQSTYPLVIKDTLGPNGPFSLSLKGLQIDSSPHTDQGLLLAEH